MISAFKIVYTRKKSSNVKTRADETEHRSQQDRERGAKSECNMVTLIKRQKSRLKVGILTIAYMGLEPYISFQISNDDSLQ